MTQPTNSGATPAALRASSGSAASIPEGEGWWRAEDGEEIEVYPLEPCDNELCLWGPEVGLHYSGAAETQFAWDTDDWQGHVPVKIYCDGRAWTRLPNTD